MRLVKLVRDDIGSGLGSTIVTYSPIPDRQEAIQALRRKLVEETLEYVLNPCVDELADVLEVVRTLAVEDLELNLATVVAWADDKADERGGFGALQGMYVQTKETER